MSKIIDFYTGCLESAGLLVDEDGYVRRPVPAEEQGLSRKAPPVIVTRKTLVVPSKAILSKFDSEKMIAFHPMCESSTRGESPIIKALVRMFTHRIQSAAFLLAEEMVHMAADSATHEKLSPTEQEFLSVLAEADEKTLKALVKVIEASDDGDNRLLKLYLKRDGVWRKDGVEKKCYRLCVVHFPIMDELERPDNTIFGVKMRVKDKQMILQLFQYLFPKSEESDNPYTFGSDSMLVPYFHSLLGSFAILAKALNSVSEVLKDHLDGYEDIAIPLSWLGELDNLAQFHDLIPVLEGNDGVISKHQFHEETPAPSIAPAAPVRAAPAQPTGTLPLTAPPTNTPPVEDGKISWGSVVSRQQHQQPVAAPLYAPPPPQYAPPAPAYYPPAQQYAPPAGPAQFYSQPAASPYAEFSRPQGQAQQYAPPAMDNRDYLRATLPRKDQGYYTAPPQYAAPPAYYPPAQQYAPPPQARYLTAPPGYGQPAPAYYPPAQPQPAAYSNRPAPLYRR